MSDETGSGAEDVARRIEAMNAAWLEGRPDDVAAFLHPRMVTVLPGFQGRVEGAEATVQSYRDFCRDARIHDFATEDVRVDVVADTAVVTYAFRIDYELGGRRLQEEGREIQVLVRDGGTWTSVWRTIVPGPPAPGS